MSLFCFYNSDIFRCDWGSVMRYLPLMLLCLTGLAQAGIYKTYDKHGNVIFSDTPTPDAQEIEDKPVATIPALSRSIIEKNAKAKTNNITATAAEPESYKITIANIKANDTFRREDPPITANIQLEPPLWKEHHLQVSLDGIALTQDNFAPQIDFSNAERGQHRLEVKAVNKKGVVINSEVVDFFVQQPSVIKPKK